MIGSSIGGFSAADHLFRDYYLEGRAGPFIIPTSMNTGPSANVSIRFGLGGPLVNVDGACASGTHSVGHAFQMIRAGSVDVALAGGADSTFTRGVMAAWSALGVLSERNDDPARACRPFSADRDGIVLGEGAGVIVLESEESARRRGKEDPGRGPRLRGVGGLSQPDAALSGWTRPGHDDGPARCRPARRAGRLRQRPRHRDALERQDRDGRHQGRLRGGRLPGPRRRQQGRAGSWHRRRGRPQS